MSKIQSDIDTSKWVDDYADMLYNYTVVRVNDHDLSHDLVQDTFISALKGLENFQRKSTVKTWLFSILKRKIIDHWRKQESRKTKPMSAYFHEDGNAGHWIENNSPKGVISGIEESLENEELGEILRDCIGRLPEKWKGIAIDKLVDGIDSEDVCKEHEITSSNLWVIIHRAKLQLRDCLEKKWLN